MKRYVLRRPFTLLEVMISITLLGLLLLYLLQSPIQSMKHSQRTLDELEAHRASDEGYLMFRKSASSLILSDGARFPLPPYTSLTATYTRTISIELAKESSQGKYFVVTVTCVKGDQTYQYRYPIICKKNAALLSYSKL